MDKSDILLLIWLIIGLIVLVVNLWYGATWMASAYLFREVGEAQKDETPNAEKSNNSHNPEEILTRAGVGKEMKPVSETPRDEELSRVGGRIPTLTSPVTHSKQNTSQVKG